MKMACHLLAVATHKLRAIGPFTDSHEPMDYLQKLANADCGWLLAGAMIKLACHLLAVAIHKL